MDFSTCTSDESLSDEHDYELLKPNGSDQVISKDYELLDPEQLMTHMNCLIDEVSSVIAVPPTSIRLLLTKFNWDKDRLLEYFFDREPEEVFREANITSPLHKMVVSIPAPDACVLTDGKKWNSTRALTPDTGGLKGKTVDLTCEICYLSYKRKDMTGLGCEHIYCNSCWRIYLTGKIIDENEGERILCPAMGCQILVDDSIVFTLMDNAAVRKRFLKLIANSFVQCNRLLTWCPGPECCYAVRMSHYEPVRIKCKCNTQFCFTCGQEWHDPVLCQYLRLWTKKIQDDSETSNWIVTNTKECPQCHVIIEKDGGCNHIVCKQPNCRYEFCWVCLDQWAPHGSSWYQCNRYNEQEAQQARDAQEVSRANLQRYLFYFSRYLNHRYSLKMENKLYIAVEKQMDEMQTQGRQWLEVQFLKSAVDILCSCRHTLMYTYVFGHFLKKNNQCIIFENNQNDLENATEQLSEYLEREISSHVFSVMKERVQDKSRYCENRRKVLLDHVHEGYEHDMWEYLDI